MESRIVDGTGSGSQAKVTATNRLVVQSVGIPLQLDTALKGRVFQVQGSVSVNNATHVALLLTNDSASRTLVVTDVLTTLYDYAGGTALPSANTYIDVGFGQVYSSGGVAATPRNTNAASALTSDVTAYDQDPTVTGTFISLETHHPKEEGDVAGFDKVCWLVVPPGETFSVRFTTDHTSGAGYVRVSFMMIDPEDL